MADVVLAGLVGFITLAALTVLRVILAPVTNALKAYTRKTTLEAEGLIAARQAWERIEQSRLGPIQSSMEAKVHHG